MSPIYGLWFALCSECGYAVKGAEGSDAAHCSNPGRRHLVQRPQRATSTTSAAAEIYHALNFRTYSEYRRSTRTAPRLQRYYLGRSRTGSVTQTRRTSSAIEKNGSKYANERYLETFHVLQQAHHALTQKERNLHQFYSNIHPDQQFYFDRIGADLQSLLLQYAEMLNCFFTGDPQADLWRSIVHERYQLEDEAEYATDIIRRFLEMRGQNVLKWNEKTDLENKLNERKTEIQARIGEFTYQGIKEKIFQEGCIRVDRFLSEIRTVLNHVNSYITDGGVEGLKWLQDSKSRKIRFYRLETEKPENSRRRSRKNSSAVVGIPGRSPWPQSPKILRGRRASQRAESLLDNRVEMLLDEPESDIDHGSDLEFRRLYGQKIPETQNVARRKNVSWADLNYEREKIKRKEQI